MIKVIVVEDKINTNIIKDKKMNKKINIIIILIIIGVIIIEIDQKNNRQQKINLKKSNKN